MIKKILVVCQTPPPLHGQAIMGEYLLQGRYEGVELVHLRMGFSEEVDECGQFSWRKVIHLFTLLFQMVYLRYKHGIKVLYYTPSISYMGRGTELPFSMAPFLKDIGILSLSKLLFAKRILHFHCSGVSLLYRDGNWIVRMCIKLAFYFPNVSIIINESNRIDAESIHSQNIVLVPNGIPDQSFHRTKEKSEKVRIIQIGKISKGKGTDTLLHAMRELQRRGVGGVELFLMGGYESLAIKEELHQYIDAHGMQTVVHFLGQKHGREKFEYVQSADIVCSCSRQETFGLTLAEGMMFGLPLIYSNIPSFLSIFSNDHGLTFSVEDPMDLADQVEVLIKNENLRKKMGAYNRKEFVEKYTVDIFQRSLSHIFNNM